MTTSSGRTDTSAPVGRVTRRIVSAAETLARVTPRLRQYGITRVANITGLDSIGIPVWAAIRPNSRSIAVSQGKGLDHVAAQVSAIMESIEAHHAETIARPVRLGSLEEIRRIVATADVRRLARTARPFDDAEPILWIEGADLDTGDGVWVPYELVHLRFTLPPLPGAGLFVATSNGLASGNHYLEALSHGLCEAIERDAMTLWSLDGEARRRSKIALDTVDDPGARALLARYDAAGVGVAVWDMTSDVGIPAFLCSIAERRPDPLRPLPIARGMGCHPDRDLALSRALTEAAQSRLTVISGARDDLEDARGAYGGDPDSRERQRRSICDGEAPRHFGDVPSKASATLEGDVEALRDGLRRAGMNAVFTADLSVDGSGICVLRVIVPGLEALRDAPGYSPGPRARAVTRGGGAS